MNRTFSILVAAGLLFASSSAEARGTTGGNSNLILPSPPPISSTPLIPPTNPIGGPIGGVGTGQNFGALPGDPGSATYNPNAALPPLNNPAGSTLTPSSGTSGITAPSTSSGTTTSP
jgi:hypothetical protein